MKENVIQLREVVASPGMVLTNGEVYGPVIYLGVNESLANWYEITEEAYQKIEAEKEATLLTEDRI